jgi:hypothetical protein
VTKSKVQAGAVTVMAFGMRVDGLDFSAISLLVTFIGNGYGNSCIAIA